MSLSRATILTLCAIASSPLPAKADLITNLIPIADTSLVESAPSNNLGGNPS